MRQQLIDLMKNGEKVTLDTPCGGIRVVRAGRGSYASLVTDEGLREFAASPSMAVQRLCERMEGKGTYRDRA
ncbi:MAG: hypothetical protein QOE33_3521 [Acidobacteriota bacterium]|nr:hypothetical protein [Acidobacteriota bacterium]